MVTTRFADKNLSDPVLTEITAMQSQLAATLAWLGANYLPDPLPPVVRDRIEQHIREFDLLRDMVEDLEATLAYHRTRNVEVVPDAVVERLLAGENPVRVWREHRGLSLRTLAKRAGISPSLLSDMETGKSEGRPSAIRDLAAILQVDMDDLIAPVERVAGSAGASGSHSGRPKH